MHSFACFSINDEIGDQRRETATGLDSFFRPRACGGPQFSLTYQMLPPYSTTSIFERPLSFDFWPPIPIVNEGDRLRLIRYASKLIESRAYSLIGSNAPLITVIL